MEITNCIEPFLTATVRVFQDLMDLKVSSGQAEPEGESFISQGFTVIVGFTGGWRGWFFLDMAQETAMRLAGNMTGENYDSIQNEDVLLSGAELGNIIGGNAITEINNIFPGLNIRLTPPSVFAGDNVSMFNLKLNSWSVKVQSTAGAIKLNVVTEEGK
ncbi:MAG TPA: chemotaxis protein CheX [Syntrophomonadaceae bacterium]|nr:chemotaxis protein CheX [Syntrophomonadaceae bacterium]